MSVRKSERKPSKMEVQTRAYELAAYTIRTAGSEKVVPKHHRWAIGNCLVQLALDLAQHIDFANTLSLDEPAERERRSLEQRLALAASFALLTAIHTAHAIAHFDADRLAHWVGLVLEVQRLLKGWRDSDRRRGRDLSDGHPL